MLSVACYVVKDNHAKINWAKGQVKTTLFSRKGWFLWSCYPDLNWGPHPYQVIGKIWSAAFWRFWGLSAPSTHTFWYSCVHCFHPLISPCGSACGSSPLALHRGFSNDNRAYSTALYVLKPYHLPNAAGDMALTLEDTARFGYVRQSGAVQSSEYSELY